MALGRSRKRIFVRGLGTLEVMQIEPTPDADFSDAGYLGGTTFNDDPGMLEVTDEQGNMIQNLRASKTCSIETKLLQTSADEVALLKNASGRVHAVRYSGLTQLDTFQYFALDTGILVPKISLDFKPGERPLPLRIVGLKQANLSYSVPEYYNFEAAAVIRTKNLQLWSNPRLGLNYQLAQALDSSGYSRHGTLSSNFATTIWQAGTSPNYFHRFNGTADTLAFGDICDVDATADWLFDIWFRIQANDGVLAVVFAKKANDVTNSAKIGYALVRKTDNTLAFYISDSSTQNVITSAATVLKNVWTHAGIAINNAGNGQLYINGVATGAPVAMTFGDTSNAQPLTIGGASDGTQFGQVDVGGIKCYNFGAASLPSDIATIISNHYTAEKTGYGL